MAAMGRRRREALYARPYFTVYGRNASLAMSFATLYQGDAISFYLLVEDEGLATLNPS